MCMVKLDLEDKRDQHISVRKKNANSVLKDPLFAQSVERHVFSAKNGPKPQPNCKFLIKVGFISEKREYIFKQKFVSYDFYNN